MKNWNFRRIFAWEFVIAALTYPTVIAKLAHPNNYRWYSLYTGLILAAILVAALLLVSRRSK